MRLSIIKMLVLIIIVSLAEVGYVHIATPQGVFLSRLQSRWFYVHCILDVIANSLAR